jgi:hypothetical protein
MSIADRVLAVNDDLPIRTNKPVHSGKVRSVYWLTDEDSARLIQEKNYDVPADTPLGIMVISDRISAFDCIWHAENGLLGVPIAKANVFFVGFNFLKGLRKTPSYQSYCKPLLPKVF